MASSLHHRCSFANDDFVVTLEADGANDGLWSRLVMLLMDELRKPDAVLILPSGLSDEEAEAIRSQWAAEWSGRG